MVSLTPDTVFCRSNDVPPADVWLHDWLGDQIYLLIESHCVNTIVKASSWPWRQVVLESGPAS